MRATSWVSLARLILLPFLLCSPVSLADDPGVSAADFFSGSRLDLKLRGYFMYRKFSEAFPAPEKIQEATAFGGWLDYQTKSFKGVSFGFSLYTSQKISAPPGREGTNLLQGSESFAVLGQVYIQAEAGKTTLKLYRQRLDTPFLNFKDFRMAPVTFEAYTLQNHSVEGLELTASYVTKIKDWASTTFESLGTNAGYDPYETRAALIGGNYQNRAKTTAIQVWGYLFEDLMGMAYAQADQTIPLSPEVSFKASAQGIYQRGTGDAIWGDFESGMGGLLATLDWKGLEVRFGGTITSKSSEILNPWGAYPGFTSIMEEDNDLAGEKSWVFGATYDFSEIGIRGLSANIDYTQAWIPNPMLGMSNAIQREGDLTVDYRFGGKLKGLWLRGRAAYVKSGLDRGTIYGQDFRDYRLILNYDVPLQGILRR